MASFRLTRAKVGSPWTLDVGDAAVLVTGPDGHPRVEIPRDQAERRIALPKRTGRRRTIWVALVDNKSVEFVPDREAVAALRAFFDAAIAAEGPEVVRSMRASGWRTTLFGLALLVGGVALVAWDRLHPEAVVKGTGNTTFNNGLILVGLIITVQGALAVARASKIAHLAAGG